jgi:ATPase subunit of ABC transporter with duplicated ATPase domains
MSGRSAVAEVMDGAGPVSFVASELKELETAMANPDRADDMEEIIARYGEVQGRFEELDGYALDGRAREALAGLGFSTEMMDGDVGALSGGWKMRVALARILLMRPDVMLLDEPSNHLDLESLIWLEQFLRGYEGALLMTSHDREFINRIINKVVEIDGGTLTTFSGNYEFYEQQRALNEKQQQAQFERQQAMLAKEIKFIERFKARASHAAQVQSRVKKLDKIERVEPPKRRQTVAFEFLPAPRSGEDVVSLKNVHKGYGSRSIYEGLDFMIRRRERWCVMGINGAGKSTLLKLVAGSTELMTARWRSAASDGLLRSARHGPARRRAHRVPVAGRFISAGGPRLAARARRLFRFFRRRCREEMPGAVGRREGAAGDGENAVRSAEFPGAGRADQPSRHGDQGDADQRALRIRGHHAVRLA